MDRPRRIVYVVTRSSILGPYISIVGIYESEIDALREANKALFRLVAAIEVEPATVHAVDDPEVK